MAFDDSIILGVLALFAGAAAVAFPVAAFLGRFERRDGNQYRFLNRRFLLCAAGFLVLLTANYAFFGFVAGNVIVGKLKAAQEERANETTRFFIANDYGRTFTAALFPDQLNSGSLACYRRAFSNYIEDHWRAAFLETACAKDDKECPVDETFYVRHYADAGFGAGLFSDLMAKDVTAAAVARTSKKLTASIEQLYHVSASEGVAAASPDEAMLTDYRHYVATCDSLPPLPWADAAVPPIREETRMCWWRCP